MWRRNHCFTFNGQEMIILAPLDKAFFRPMRMGLVIYNNYDDWKTLAHDTCTVLGRVLINFGYVRFAPTTTTFVQAQQMTRWANSGR
jgi:hypothetical protein